MMIIIFLVFMFLAMNLMALPETIYDIGLIYHLSGIQKGSLQLTSGIGAILAALLGGYASEVFGKKRTLVVGLIIAIASNFLVAGGAGYVSLHFYSVALVLMVCLGCGNGIMEGLSNVLTVHIHPERKALYLNLGHAFFAGGAVLGPIIAGYLMRISDWKSVFYFNGVFGLGILFLLIFSACPSGAGLGKIRWSHIRALAKNKEFSMVNASVSLAVGAEIGLVYWLIEYVRTNPDFMLSYFNAGLMLSYFWVAILIGRFAYGWLVEFTSYRFSLCLSCVGGVLSLLTFLYTNNLRLAVTMVILYGFFLSGLLPTLYSLAGEKFRLYPGVVFGTVAASLGLGTGIFPHMIGAISDLPLFDLRLALGVCILCLIVLFIIVWQITGKRAGGQHELHNA